MASVAPFLLGALLRLTCVSAHPALLFPLKNTAIRPNSNRGNRLENERERIRIRKMSLPDGFYCGSALPPPSGAPDMTEAFRMIIDDPPPFTDEELMERIGNIETKLLEGKLLCKDEKLLWIGVRMQLDAKLRTDYCTQFGPNQEAVCCLIVAGGEKFGFCSLVSHIHGRLPEEELPACLHAPSKRSHPGSKKEKRRIRRHFQGVNRSCRAKRRKALHLLKKKARCVRNRECGDTTDNSIEMREFSRAVDYFALPSKDDSSVGTDLETSSRFYYTRFINLFESGCTESDVYNLCSAFCCLDDSLGCDFCDLECY